MEGRFQIALEYPVRPTPRWGHGKPMHAELERRLADGRERYADLLRGVLAFREDLVGIPREPDPVDLTVPSWINGFLAGLDSALLYSLLRVHGPRVYVEIGSGHSTRFRAARDRRWRARDADHLDRSCSSRGDRGHLRRIDP